ncbi:hypothetical protein M9H77_07262 [Catharanthus roseus]|uniref:Uncharacterized protein n=1 Tax=Catharanthus roseus TaxID=4058 RepID=A0ACC0BUE3_CATRO|nr:hypothetical protein M9H77_07262 [Catharanthus roseus]
MLHRKKKKKVVAELPLRKDSSRSSESRFQLLAALPTQEETQNENVAKLKELIQAIQEPQLIPKKQVKAKPKGKILPPKANTDFDFDMIDSIDPQEVCLELLDKDVVLLQQDIMEA